MPYNKGAQKAMRAFKRRYGANWRRYFYGRASKYGKGKTPHAKANSVFGKGKHRVRQVRRGR